MLERYFRKSVKQRKGKSDPALVVKAILVLAAIALVIRYINAIGVAALIIGIALIVILAVFVFSKSQKRAAHVAAMRAKYGDEALVQRIVRREHWRGQTMEQLEDSLGPPAGVDKNLLKTRKREVWKYHPNGKGRFRLRITLDDDVVDTWSHKD